jgi:hypothetical protein
VHAELPHELAAAHPFRTVTGVNLGLADEWRGRIYLFDAPPKASNARSTFWKRSPSMSRRR